MLFLELALIRWLGSNVVHLSYFSNFVLLGSFLGIGLGFLIAAAPGRWSRVAPLSAGPAGRRASGSFPVSIDRTGSDVIYFTCSSTTGRRRGWCCRSSSCVVALVMAGPAELVGRCFADLPPLTAYRWDLIGSLIGIGGFTVLSFLRAPPVVWGAIVAVAVRRCSVPNLRRAGRGARGRGRGRRSCSFETIAAGHQLVAVLQGHHRGRRSWQPVARAASRSTASRTR